jgi:hypothetical protein
MTVEERLRDTTEAVAAAMRPLRPLDLRPDSAAAQAPARYRRPRRPHRWPGWLIPLAAAAAVVAVAASLVAVRSLPDAKSGAQSTQSAASASGATLADGLPRYYVAMSYMSASPQGAEIQNAYLAETSTGQHLANFTPPPDAMFTMVAAAADDTTFVLRALAGPHYGPAGTKFPENQLNVESEIQTLWYVVRVPPGAPQQARLARIAIASSFQNDAIDAIALSPDGRTLALAFYKNGGTSGGFQTSVQTYSVATGRVLRTWTGVVPGTVGTLSWLNDGRTLAFGYSVFDGGGPASVRTLDNDGQGSSLLGDSRPVFSAPSGATCGSMLITEDGKAVICGSTPFNSGCANGAVNLAAYSVATGKLERVLYRFPGPCRVGGAQVQWAGSATLAIAEIVYTKPVSPYPQLMATVGVVPPGQSAGLPVNLGETYDGLGTIAF